VAGRQTVGEFAETWWKTRTGHRRSTRVRDRQALDRDMLPFFCDAPLGRLDRSDVQQWVEMLSIRLAPSTVRRTYVILEQLLAAAVDRGSIAPSPADGITLPRIARSEARFLTSRELEALASTIDPRYRAMVLVMAWGTLRIGESCGLRRRDVNLGAGTLRIENNAVQVLGRMIEGPPKTRAGRRTMTLSSSVLDELGQHLDRQPGTTYVFGPSGECPFFADDWRARPWQRAVRAASVSPSGLMIWSTPVSCSSPLPESIPRKSPDGRVTARSR
jgi:integrase